jgi:hypothetical protein
VAATRRSSLATAGRNAGSAIQLTGHEIPLGNPDPNAQGEVCVDHLVLGGTGLEGACPEIALVIPALGADVRNPSLDDLAKDGFCLRGSFLIVRTNDSDADALPAIRLQAQAVRKVLRAAAATPCAAARPRPR